MGFAPPDGSQAVDRSGSARQIAADPVASGAPSDNLKAHKEASISASESTENKLTKHELVQAYVSAMHEWTTELHNTKTMMQNAPGYREQQVKENEAHERYQKAALAFINTNWTSE